MQLSIKRHCEYTQNLELCSQNIFKQDSSVTIGNKRKQKNILWLWIYLLLLFCGSTNKSMASSFKNKNYDWISIYQTEDWDLDQKEKKFSEYTEMSPTSPFINCSIFLY